MMPVISPVASSTPAQGTTNQAVQSAQFNFGTMERGRSRSKKKRCQRESSSSDEGSLEREATRWREPRIREGSRNPPPPKLPIFTGNDG